MSRHLSNILMDEDVAYRNKKLTNFVDNQRNITKDIIAKGKPVFGGSRIKSISNVTIKNANKNNGVVFKISSRSNSPKILLNYIAEKTNNMVYNSEGKEVSVNEISYDNDYPLNSKLLDNKKKPASNVHLIISLKGINHNKDVVVKVLEDCLYHKFGMNGFKYHFNVHVDNGNTHMHVSMSLLNDKNRSLRINKLDIKHIKGLMAYSLLNNGVNLVDGVSRDYSNKIKYKNAFDFSNIVKAFNDDIIAEAFKNRTKSKIVIGDEHEILINNKDFFNKINDAFLLQKPIANEEFKVLSDDVLKSDKQIVNTYFTHFLAKHFDSNLVDSHLLNNMLVFDKKIYEPSKLNESYLVTKHKYGKVIPFFRLLLKDVKSADKLIEKKAKETIDILFKAEGKLDIKNLNRTYLSQPNKVKESIKGKPINLDMRKTSVPSHLKLIKLINETLRIGNTLPKSDDIPKIVDILISNGISNCKGIYIQSKENKQNYTLINISDFIKKKIPIVAKKNTGRKNKGR